MRMVCQPLSGALQKYFQLGTVLAKASPVHACILTIRHVHYEIFRGSGIFQNLYFKFRWNPIAEQHVRTKLS